MKLAGQQELVILVNDQGQVIGFKEKLLAHRDGDLHQAFSIFVFNNRGQLLLQQRAKEEASWNG